MQKITSVAPGRTCLLGDHQDYLSLPVIACAIDRHFILTAVLGAKIVGSGRGGSIAVLAAPEEVDKVIGAVKSAGAKDAYRVSVDPGARVSGT